MNLSNIARKTLSWSSQSSYSFLINITLSEDGNKEDRLTFFSITRINILMGMLIGCKEQDHGTCKWRTKKKGQLRLKPFLSWQLYFFHFLSSPKITNFKFIQSSCSHCHKRKFGDSLNEILPFVGTRSSMLVFNSRHS